MARLTLELFNKRFTHTENREGNSRRLIFDSQISYGTLVVKDIGEIANGEVTLVETSGEFAKKNNHLEPKIVYSVSFVDRDTDILFPHSFRVLLMLSSDTFNHLLGLDTAKNSINIQIDTVGLLREGAIYYGDDPDKDEKIWDINIAKMVLLSNMSINIVN